MSHQQEESEEFRKRHIGEMEQSDSEQESIIFPRNSHNKSDLIKQNISEPERSKRMLVPNLTNSDQVVKMCRRTTMRNSWRSYVMKSGCIHWWVLWQSSEEIEQEQTNASALTSIFEIQGMTKKFHKVTKKFSQNDKKNFIKRQKIFTIIKL